MAKVAARLSLDPKTTKALLIGVGDYEHLPNINPALGNLEGMQQLLTDPEILGLAPEQITRVENKRHDQIFDAIADFVEDKNNLEIQTLLLYYAGHGLRESAVSKELFLSGTNTRKNRLHTTGIRFNQIKQKLESSHLQSRLLFLDACYSGLAAMSEEAATLTDQEATIKGTYVLASAGEEEKAYFDTDAPRTFFTDALLQVVEKGWTDRRPLVSLEDLYDRLRSDYQHATPKRKNNLQAREFYLFRNRGLDPERIWQETRQAGTEQAYEEYLGLFPHGPHLEAALWERAQLLSKPAGYAAYLERFPAGEHALAAKEEQSWLQAKAANTIEAWLGFVRIYHQVEEARTELRVEEAYDQIGRLGKNPRLDKNRINQLKVQVGEWKGKVAQLKAEKADLANQLTEEKKIHQQTQGKLQALAEDLEQAEQQVEALKKKLAAQPKSKILPNPRFDFPVPEMILIEGGTFRMGSNEDDREKPIHEVTLDSFEMGIYPVTQAEWKAVMGDNPSKFRGNDLPVEHVSWDECQVFIQKLNEKTGRKYRLPTEAEWEYAAGGGKVDRLIWAGTDSETELDDYAWYDKNSNEQTYPVGQKKPNPLGLHDMSGNVWEWCQDWYGDYPSGPQINPTGPSNGAERVIRGGSWGIVDALCRVAFRSAWDPDLPYSGLGFRLARTP